LAKGLRVRGESIRAYILENAEASGLALRVANHFNITRQAVGLHLQELVKEGALVAEGNTRNRTYKLCSKEVLVRSYEIKPGLAEDTVWRKDISEILGHLPRNVFEMWEYSFTEMFNNAIDHSGGTTIDVTVWKTAIDTLIAIGDDGVGIFAKIKAALDLEDERHAILELSKGKLTTDAKNHSGEGIFFTSRMVNRFDILAGGVQFSHVIGKPHDWVIDQEPVLGTRVYLKIDNHTARTVKNTLAQYSIGDQFGFNRTVVPVKLAQYQNDQLISRSQAKRLLARAELFAEVLFDFTGVESIGKPFADQIFRVFQNEHPRMVIHSGHTNAQVQLVINEVLQQRRLEQKEEAKSTRMQAANAG
jgi:hypothetical protein